MNITIVSLIITGIVTAAVGILGFSIFLNNRKGITNKSFYIFSLFTIAYIVTNYIAYATTNVGIGLILFRITIFFAVWHAFWIFQLLYVFPKEEVKFPGWYRYAVIPVTAIVSLLTLTPFVFSRVATVSGTGQVVGIMNGPGIAVFGLLVIFLIASGFIFLIRKTIRADAAQKLPFRYVLVGTIITFTLLIVFNFILPAFFNDSQFISFGPLSFFPLIILTFYAITRHGLLGVKVISTEILAFVLSVVTLMDLITATSIAAILSRLGIFILILIFSMFLIQSVQREVEQREELERLNKKIAADNQQLEELGRFKSQLLSLASHQIRSPLGAMKGFISLIIGGSYGEVNDKVKETLGKVQKSADELINLINTLLDMRKVEEGKMEYTFEKVDLVPLIAGTVESIMPLAQAKNISLTSALPPAPVMVSIDKEKFKQVIQNLIDNAIKYTPVGFVKVELTTAQGKACIAVSDSGYGIPASLVPFLFEEFIRDERIKKEVRGTGLGLYIARKIAEAHGGTLMAESPGEGKGSTFKAIIPVAP
jgi:signal transduction histidine kinase